MEAVSSMGSSGTLGAHGALSAQRQPPTVAGASSTLLSGRWLVAARIAWVVALVGMLAAFVIQIPYYLAFMSRACPDTCAFTREQEAALASIGVSLKTFALIALSCTTVIALISVVLALIIFRRRWSYGPITRRNQ